MRNHLALIAILFGLTLVMAIPDVGSSVMLMTLGLGAPLVFSGTGVLYALCAFPLPFLWDEEPNGPLVGAMLAGALIVICAFTPYFLGPRWAETMAQGFRAADHSPTDPVGAATIEIRRPSQSFDHTFAGQEACGAECRGVLSEGAVRWVRVVMVDAWAHKQESSTFYRALHGGECAVPGGSNSEGAICVVMAPDTGEAAELTIEFETPPSVGGGATELAVLRGARAVVAYRTQAGRAEEVLRQTEVTFETPDWPTLLGPQFQGLHSHGIDMVRKSTSINPITLGGVLTQLGYSVAPLPSARRPAPSTADWRQSIDDDMTREMVAVLDLPQTEPFNSEQMRPIFNWIAHARAVKDWTPELIALLRRFVRDPRIRAPTPFDQIFERNPNVAKALMSDVLDVIATAGIGRDYTPARQAAYTFARLDSKILKPNADRFVALLDHGRDVRAILLPAIGLVGVDPSPYLLPIDADRTDPSPYSQNPRVVGACRAEKIWAPQLIGPLRESFHNLPSATPDDVEYLERVLRALQNLGDHDFVERQLASDGRIDAARLRLKLQGDQKRPVPSDWLCNSF